MTSDNQTKHIRMIIRSLEDNNEVFFSNTAESEPALEITLGEGQIFPKVEELLVEMQPGETKTVNLTKDEAFGDIIDEAIQKVALDQIPEELRKPGTKISAQTEDDQTAHGIIIAIEEQIAVIDFNHPLAGKSIEVEFFIVE